MSSVKPSRAAGSGNVCRRVMFLPVFFRLSVGLRKNYKTGLGLEYISLPKIKGPIPEFFSFSRIMQDF